MSLWSRVARWRRRRTVVDGVRYTESGAESLDRALSRRGRGFKEYRVAFPDGSRMRIRATPRREYADLSGPRLLDALRPADQALRPGMRALVLRGGTGYVAEWLARLVGPSGAVVSVEPDEEAARFAQRRYRLPNVAYEEGWLEALRGEADGAFDAVIAVEAAWVGDDPVAIVREGWRLVAEEGWLLVGGPVGEAAEDGPLPMSPGSLHALVAAALQGALPAEYPEIPPPPADAPAPAWVVAAVRRQAPPEATPETPESPG